MKDFPLITIGVLCYNTGEFVVESLDCIKRQNYPNVEIIIIDDCSTDGISVDLVQKYIENNHLQCSFIRQKENKGISYNLNEIIEKTNSISKYLVLLGDDLWDDDFLRKSAEILEQSDENEILLYSDVRMMDYDTKEIIDETNSMTIHPNSENSQRLFSEHKGDLYKLKNKDLMEFLFETNPIYPIGMMLKTQPFKKAGGYCNKYFFEDYPTWFKLAKQGFDFLYYHKTLTTYVRHGKNISNIRNNEIRQVNRALTIENIAYCNRLYTLKKIVPQLIYNHGGEGWFSLAKIKFALHLMLQNKKIFPAIVSNIIDKVFKIERTY